MVDVYLRAPRLAEFAIGPSRSDPQRALRRYSEQVRETFAYAPPPVPDPAHPWRGYAMYPTELLDSLWWERRRATLTRELAPFGIEVD